LGKRRGSLIFDRLCLLARHGFGAILPSSDKPISRACPVLRQFLPFRCPVSAEKSSHRVPALREMPPISHDLGWPGI